ncbi:MAG: type II toxin-antitoxin system VapC family toxin [SAR324 cluster bacterium]|nr:type II toxin-antitoxin system VapC family toxin [SAR324 cluster bacterium]
MNVVDSCGWLEYFADGANANFFAPAIEDMAHSIVPSICLMEVFKRVSQQRGEADAFQAVALMQQAKVIDLDIAIALEAAKLGLALKLPLADSIILATARKYDAIVWTQDDDFEGIEGIKYTPKIK